MSQSILWFLKSKKGVTLLELSVVAAIITILSAMAAIGVTGTTQQARSSALAGDKDQVQKAVYSYIAEQSDGKYPTIDGCLPGQSFSSTKRCSTGTDPGAFNLADSLTFKAIIWSKAFTATNSSGGTTTKAFVTNFLQQTPRHAYEHADGTAWPTATTIDPDGVVSGGLRAPSSGSAAVWALDRDGAVQITILPSQY